MVIDQHWFRDALRLRGSVIPAIWPRTLLCTAIGAIASVLYALDINVALPFNSIIPDLVLGLLLVFRTNTAYARFWEGRQLWGSLVNATRNLGRQIWINVRERSEQDRETKTATVRLLSAFAVALKLHLRGESLEPLQAFMSLPQFKSLNQENHVPLQIAFWIGDYLQLQYQRDRLPVYQLHGMQELLNKLVDVLGGSERILKTPIPLAYAIHLKQLLLLYCCVLPFLVVDTWGVWTGVVTGIVSFTVFGIEEIGVEIENPFGHDPNDLPLDAICQTIAQNMEALIAAQPRTTPPLSIETGISRTHP
ncbi:MAG: bestrophin family protein [Elainellaceae cyanobacterium]